MNLSAGRGPSGMEATAQHPRISVVVCTRDRPERLARALRSLTVQSAPAAEIIVIDNAATDDAARSLVVDRFPGVVYVAEAVPGLDVARNRALAVARDDIVAFLDDDAVADPDWVRRIAEVFRGRPEIAACTGRIEPLSLETPAQRLFEANGGLSPKTDRRLRLPRDGPRHFAYRDPPAFLCALSFGAGCNFAVRREAALDVGGFDEALGVGTLVAGSDENDMLWRLLRKGFEFVFEPAALVRHEHRDDMESVSRQLVGYEHALVAWLTKLLRRSTGRERFFIFVFLVWRLFKPGARLARRAVGRDPLPSGILLRMWLGCWRGLTAYSRSCRQVLRRRREALT